ncbi:uncharacterized protein LOC134185014 [Corticium candelabrum]|uniref:uncharacterized protein LOC134185014 n=1 Tax=Corticium candelabrum TaxID=121492 RepID=UPI002E308CDA|nr:uncharacterized protein LOC134185014 [Corticium candelabrum]
MCTESHKWVGIRVLLRMASLVFGVIVVSVVANVYVNRYWYRDYDLSKPFCYLGIACGSVSLIAAVALSALDFLVHVCKMNRVKKGIVLGCGVSELVMSMLWISCSIVLTKTWDDTVRRNVNYDFSYDLEGRVYAILAFSFLSFLSWTSVTIADFIALRAIIISHPSTNQANADHFPTNPPGYNTLAHYPVHTSDSFIVYPSAYPGPPSCPPDHPLDHTFDHPLVPAVKLNADSTILARTF